MLLGNAALERHAQSQGEDVWVRIQTQTAARDSWSLDCLRRKDYGEIILRGCHLFLCRFSSRLFYTLESTTSYISSPPHSASFHSPRVTEPCASAAESAKKPTLQNHGCQRFLAPFFLLCRLFPRSENFSLMYKTLTNLMVKQWMFL